MPLGLGSGCPFSGAPAGAPLVADAGVFFAGGRPQHPGSGRSEGCVPAARTVSGMDTDAAGAAAGKGGGLRGSFLAC